ncbi:S8 family peptidase [Aureispira anguillae]|uniref:S8 family serine peptidase n=1 Tax=Aureispira anguillae TaxID=2864201 RepID=A0A916DT73_9BACT|nr:S8 family serine peptidase [Aureispira anguillae]BDS11261.1 S8 family serine peptidase [Aureispira anguillae]
MKLLTLLFIIIVFTSSPNLAQKVDYNHHNHSLHWVELTDKNKTPYSIFRPQDFLSAKAILRRETMGIPLEENDLPITPAYIQKIKSMGAPIHAKSKWLNSLAIHTRDEALLEAIRKLPFVKSVKPLGKYRKVSKPILKKNRPAVDPSKHEIDYYGQADNQIKMLGGDVLHNYGYTGKGIHVAIFDGGFLNVYRMPVFDSIYANNRLLGTHDFVEGDDFVYEGSSHGTNVLACMGSKAPHLIVGTAPDASYYLFKTEDVKGEFRVEEFNWVAALEHADSIGVDVINSSLGYTGFNDSTMSYKYHQLDGKTALCSRGAEIGASKGLLIVNSAGNEGDGKWHYIGTPADAKGVLSVAAVRPNGTRASFSSWGPTVDGRIKPDVAAQGRYTVVASMDKYNITRTNGTSFSSPVMAGMVASLKQAFPNKTSEEIKDAIRLSGSISYQPDSSLGYGIPNFFFAYMTMLEASIIIDHKGGMYYTPKPIQEQLHLFIEQRKPASLKVTIYDKMMQEKFQYTGATKGKEIKEIRLPNVREYPSGLYIIKIEVDAYPYWVEMVKE